MAKTARVADLEPEAEAEAAPVQAVDFGGDEDPGAQIVSRAGGWEWRMMDSAPTDRPLYLTADPDADPAGTLAQWRRSRRKVNRRKGWEPIAYWAAVLTQRALTFEPLCWRPAGPAGAGDAAAAG